jgi:hypothetical protein
MEPRDWTDRAFDPSKGPILVRVATVEQLFNPIDPQPFNLRDLDVEVADWIGEWAEEQRGHGEITIKVLIADDSAADSEELVAEGIRNHFAYRRWATARLLSRLWRDGRISLAIGLAALVALSAASRLVVSNSGNAYVSLLREGLAVAGWVAMWRPMEIFLYEWWPIRRELRTFQRLADARVVFITTTPH